MDSLTISSAMIIPAAENGDLNPAMLSVVWVIADALDGKRLPANPEDAVWLELPTKRLRNPDGRDDNYWLRQCLDRLMGIKLKGEYRGDPWGAVILAQYEIGQGGSMVRLLIPPAAIQAITSPKTFAKIELSAAYQLSGAAKRLYVALADKKRMGKPYWIYSIEDLRVVMGTGGQYKSWYDFRRYVLQTAIDEINDYGTVTVRMTPEKTGRAVTSVRFDWTWKTLDDVRDTATENERHSTARRKQQADHDAPPIIKDAALAWWDALSDDDREMWGDRVGRTFDTDMGPVERRRSDMALAAYPEHLRSSEK